jgi:large subunit ribosomal protein L20
MSYSVFMGKLAKSDLNINRKVLADIAMNDPEGFKAIVEAVAKS